MTLHAINPLANRWERFIRIVPTVFSRACDIDGDLYHFHDPEFLPHLIIFRHEIGKPFIDDIHEDYSATIFSKQWVPKIFRVALSMMVDVVRKKIS